MGGSLGGCVQAFVGGCVGGRVGSHLVGCVPRYCAVGGDHLSDDLLFFVCFFLSSAPLWHISVYHLWVETPGDPVVFFSVEVVLAFFVMVTLSVIFFGYFFLSAIYTGPALA